MKDLKTDRLRFVPMIGEKMRELSNKPRADENMDSALHDINNGCDTKDLHWRTKWQIILRSDETHIGGFYFKGAPENGAVELVFWIDEPYRNKGYVTETVKVAADWAFSKGVVYFVTAEIKKDNPASYNVLKKNGFELISESEEGARWMKEKPKMLWMPIYMCIGVGSGLSIGVALGGIALGLAIGLCFGLAVGSILDISFRTIREKYRKALK